MRITIRTSALFLCGLLLGVAAAQAAEDADPRRTANGPGQINANDDEWFLTFLHDPALSPPRGSCPHSVPPPVPPLELLLKLGKKGRLAL